MKGIRRKGRSFLLGKRKEPKENHVRRLRGIPSHVNGANISFFLLLFLSKEKEGFTSPSFFHPCLWMEALVCA